MWLYSFDSETNTLFLNATIDYILSTERFEKLLFKKKNVFLFICNYLIISELPVFVFLFFDVLFCIPRHLEFQCLVVDFLVYYVILYTNIYILKKCDILYLILMMYEKDLNWFCLVNKDSPHFCFEICRY